MTQLEFIAKAQEFCKANSVAHDVFIRIADNTVIAPIQSNTELFVKFLEDNELNYSGPFELLKGVFDIYVKL